MKVRVMVEQEVEADVSIDDVFSEIRALPYEQGANAVLNAIKTAHKVLASITDEQIEAVSADKRALIADAVEKQAARYGKDGGR